KNVERAGRQRRLGNHGLEAHDGIDRRKSAHQMAGTFGQRKGPKIETRDGSKSSKRADQQFVQIVAGDVFHYAPAAFRKSAGSVNEFSPQQKISRRTIAGPQSGTNVRHNRSANRAF